MRSVFRTLVVLLFLASLVFAVLTVFQANFFIIARPQMSQASSNGELPSDWPSVFFCNGTVCNEPFIGEVGDTITIALVAFNLTDSIVTDPENPTVTHPLGNLDGFDVQLSWDPTVLKYVTHTLTVPVEKYPNPVPPSPYAGILHEEAFQIMNVTDENDDIPNSEPGTMAWFAYAIMPGATLFNGNGTFFTMTFNVMKRGSSPLKLTNLLLSGEGGFSKRVKCHQFDGLFRTADAPIADFTFWPDVGVVDKPVVFNASASYDPDGSIVSYVWDFGDENVTVVNDPIITHSYSESGTYAVSLVVEDSDGVRSSPKTEQVSVVEKRNVKVADVSLTPAHVVLVNRTVDIGVWVENDGGADENCTVQTYYNATAVNWTDISTTDWIKIGETDVSLPLENSWAIKHFTWNTSGVPKVNAYYYVLANATLVPYEGDVKDNNMTSSDSIFVRSLLIRDVAVEKLEFGWSEAIKSPVLDGENTTFQITVLNEGTENETAVNVTLYCNGSELRSWTESLAYGQAVELRWQELLDPGTYNITASATIEYDVHPYDNRREGILRVIRTPQLNISYSPECVLVNQTVLLDSSASFHREPGASITEYKWHIFDPEGTLVEILSGPDLVNTTYQFGEEGEWRVVLSVTDSFNIEYDWRRPATSAYQIETRINVEEGSTSCFEAGTWNDITYYINVTSNSTINDFCFNPDDGPFIQFTVTGSSGTQGMCQVAIPKPLLWVEDGWQIYVAGEPLTNYTVIQDENITYLYFTYTHSTRTVLIEGSNVIREFSSTTISLCMVISLITLILAKRKHPKQQKP